MWVLESKMSHENVSFAIVALGDGDDVGVFS